MSRRQNSYKSTTLVPRKFFERRKKMSDKKRLFNSVDSHQQPTTSSNGGKEKLKTTIVEDFEIKKRPKVFETGLKTNQQPIKLGTSEEMPPNINRSEKIIKSELRSTTAEKVSIEIVKKFPEPTIILLAEDKAPIIPFCGPNSMFSNEHPTEFEVKGTKFISPDHYYLSIKALHSHDKELSDKIQASRCLEEIKNLSDSIENFDLEKWSKMCWKVVMRGNLEKYLAHQDMRLQLLRTIGAHLVLASKEDDYWGIGMDADDPDLSNKSKWKGHNVQGEILMELRDYLSTLPEFADEVELAKKHLIVEAHLETK